MGKGLAIAVTVGGAALLLGGCGGVRLPGADPESPPGTFEITGAISVPSSTYVPSGTDQPGGFCSVKDGYEDLRTGASVTVTNAAGDIVGVANLVDTDRAASQCRYSFDVRGVPDGAQAYGIEVADRGVVEFTRDQLERAVELPVD